MQAFAAGELRPGIGTFAFQKFAHAHCRLDREVPRNTLAVTLSAARC
jgi:hypothetical protein